MTHNIPCNNESSGCFTMIQLFILLSVLAGLAVYKYRVYFAPCDPGTVEVSGWTDAGYTRLCIPAALVPAPAAP